LEELPAKLTVSVVGPSVADEAKARDADADADDANADDAIADEANEDAKSAASRIDFMDSPNEIALEFEKIQSQRKRMTFERHQSELEKKRLRVQFLTRTRNAKSTLQLQRGNSNNLLLADTEFIELYKIQWAKTVSSHALRTMTQRRKVELGHASPCR